MYPSPFYNNFVSLTYVRPGIHTSASTYFCNLLKKKERKTFACVQRLLDERVKLQSTGTKKKGQTSGGGKLKAGPNLVR